MKKTYWYILFILTLNAGIVSHSSAQLSKLTASYQSFHVSKFLNGRIYTPPAQRIEGSPFFLEKKLFQGSILYDSIRYNNLMLQYDVFQEQLIVQYEQENNNFLIVINSEHLMEFSLENNEFIIYKDSLLKKGIYQNLFESPASKLLVHHEKYLSVDNNRRVNNFIIDKNYYLLYKNKSFSIDNKKDLIIAFEKDPKIKALIKANHLKFNSENIESSLVIILENLQ